MKFGSNPLGAIKCIHSLSGARLKQTGSNSFANYKYFTQLDLAKISEQCIEQGYILLFSVESHGIKSEFVSKGDKKQLVTYADCSALLRLQGVEDAEDYVEVECYGYKVDNGSDKALGAATIAKRYAIMQMFDIPTVESDPDSDDSDYRRLDAREPKSEVKPTRKFKL